MLITMTKGTPTSFQSVSQPMKQLINQSFNQSINHSIHSPHHHLASQDTYYLCTYACVIYTLYSSKCNSHRNSTLPQRSEISTQSITHGIYKQDVTRERLKDQWRMARVRGCRNMPRARRYLHPRTSAGWNGPRGVLEWCLVFITWCF